MPLISTCGVGIALFLSVFPAAVVNRLVVLRERLNGMEKVRVTGL